MTGPCRELKRPGLWLALWILGIALVTAGSLMPARGIPVPMADGSDKVLHFSAYFVLAGWAGGLFRRRRALLLSAAGLLALGCAIEWAQSALTASRSADPLDLLANGLGVLCGMLLIVWMFPQVLQKLERRVLRR